MGCSPYFATTGAHPILPFDITEATYLQEPPVRLLSSTELMARRALALQKRATDLEKLHSKVLEARIRAAEQFEEKHAATIKDYDFKQGNLVLIRNTQIEKSLNRKMRPRYLGPLIVLARNRGGAYLVCELDGTLFDRPIAAFRVIPYLARKSIPLPSLDELLDVSLARFKELRESDNLGDDNDVDMHDPDDLEDIEGNKHEIDGVTVHQSVTLFRFYLAFHAKLDCLLLTIPFKIG